MNWGSILTLLITNGVTLIGGLYATRKKFQSSTKNKSSDIDVEKEGIYARYSQQLVDTLEKVRQERDTLNEKVNELQITVNKQSFTIDRQNEKIDVLTKSVDKLTKIIKERGIGIEET